MSVQTTSVERIRRSVVSFGESRAELLFYYLPDDISFVPEIIRRTYHSYSRHRIDSDLLDDYIRELDHISKIENFIHYVLAYYVISASLGKVKALDLLNFLRQNHSRVKFFEEPTSRANAEELAELVCRNFGELQRVRLSLRYLSKGIRRITAKKRVHHFIAVQRKLQNFEKYLREYFVSYSLGEKGTKSARSVLRLFIHRTNAPISIAIASSNEHKKYVPIVDMYTAMVTVRSGAFEDLGGEQVRKIVSKMASEKGLNSTLRLEHIRGVVRAVARASDEPILYERGAFYIGYNYCSKLDCGACPIKEVCRKYTWVKVK